jgi:hypothetical protein
MILSAEALEIINYLKTDPGRFVSLLEISRRAGGRRRFEQSRGWARNLMSPLIDAGLIEVNARGHYRATGSAQPHAALKASDAPTRRTPSKRQAKVVGEDYFPTNTGPQIVAGDYFPD